MTLWLRRRYIPYHLAFGDIVVTHQPTAIVSVHSFNPVYEEERREFEIGVLSSHDDATSHSHISRPLPSIAAANTAPQDQRQRNEENNGHDNAKDAFSKAMAVPEPVVAVMIVVMEGVALEEVF